MLIHFSYPYSPSASFGYPDRTVQDKSLPFGKLHLFSPNRAELVVLVETNTPLLGEYQKKLPGVGPLKKTYLSDRAYSASSLLAVALQQGLLHVLNQTPAPSQGTLRIHLPVFYCPEPSAFAEALWKTLGYEVQVETIPWNADFPDWGGSNYHALTLATSLPFEWVLRHLCTLLPVFDDHKFEWLSPIQIEHFKLCAEVWLKGHPMLSEILKRYATVLPPPHPRVSEQLQLSHFSELTAALQNTNALLHTTLQTIRTLKNNPSFCTFKTELIRAIPVQTKDILKALDVLLVARITPACLLYNPPTMPPSLPSQKTSLLEHPQEIFDYYKRTGVKEIICQEKHMGRRRTIFVGQTPEVMQKKFGYLQKRLGFQLPRIKMTTQDGAFFKHGLPVENELLVHLGQLLSETDFWGEFSTTWVYLDCEQLPWTASNRPLPPGRYMNIRPSTAGLAHTAATLGLLSQLAHQGLSLESLATSYETHYHHLLAYLNAYRPYCWAVEGYLDLKLAPFNILATEGHTYFDKTHQWHLEVIKKLADADQHNVLIPTQYLVVDLQSQNQINDAILWWENILLHGGEGMIVKPFHFVERNEKGLIQPAIKCRGPNYLKLVYGPDYRVPENLLFLKQNRRTGLKERLAFQEFALAMEALERFVKDEPIEKVFECVLASLALDFGYRS